MTSWVISSGRISYCHTAHPRSCPRSRNTNESRVAGTWATSNLSDLGLEAEPVVWAVAADASGRLASSRKQGQRIGLENRLLVRVAERQRQELVDVEPHIFHARARPVGAPEDLIRELRQTRKVLQQAGGRYPGDVEPHPPVASQNEKRLLHVERPAAVRHYDAEIGKIDRDVVELHRVAVLGARPGENTGAGVDHHRQPPLLAPPVDRPQGGETVGVGVRRHALVRRMNLDEPDPEVGKAVYVTRRVLREAGVHAPVRQQALSVGL